MTKRMFFALALTLGLIPMQAQAQLPTLLTVSGSVGGGLSLASAKIFNGTSIQDANFAGFNVGGKLKVGLPLSPVIIVGHLALNQLSASQSGTDYGFQIFSAGAGIEYILVPLPLLSPYLALDAALSSSKNTKPFDSDAINRTGIGIGAGVEIGIPLSPISIDVEAKYRFANLIGKVDGEENSNYVQIWATLVFKLL